MISDDLRNAIYGQLDSLRPGSLSFWGDWFGSPYDNIHRIVGADSFAGPVVVYFDHGETLIVEQPRQWSLEGGRLVIREADRVCFQWFYYGSLPSRQSLQLREYRWNDGDMTFATDFQPGRRPELNRQSPAVELHALC